MKAIEQYFSDCGCDQYGYFHVVIVIFSLL